MNRHDSDQLLDIDISSVLFNCIYLYVREQNVDISSYSLVSMYVL